MPSWLVPRPALHGTRHAVSSGHYLASAAGFAILEAGGNAVDAGCAAGIALAVLHADEVNFAGVAPIMIRTAAGRVVTIDGLGVWPRALPSDLFMREHAGTIPAGILRTVTPAAPDAWITALRDFGTHVVRRGRRGRDPPRPRRLRGVPAARRAGSRCAVPATRGGRRTRRSSSPSGRPPRVGERFVQPDLAATLQYMADCEQRAAWRSARPASRPRAPRSTKATSPSGSSRTSGRTAAISPMTDLAGFRCRYEEPVSTRWRDWTILTCGPWCQGPLLAQALLTLEAAGLDGLEHNSAAYVHRVVEALKGVFADREHHYGDPAFVDVPLERLLSDEHARERRAPDRPATARRPELPPPLFGAAQPLPAPSESEAAPRVGEGGTSYVCVVDRWGNAFSATPSDGASSAPVVPGTGIVPSLRGLQSRPDPAHPSGVAPGKRPRLTPNPAIAVRDDGSVLPFGCPGGDAQVQAMLQVFLNAFHFGMDLQEVGQRAALRDLELPQLVRAVRIPAREALRRGPPRRGRALATSSAAGTGSSAGPTSPGRPRRSRPSSSTAQSGFLHAAADPRQPAAAIVA